MNQKTHSMVGQKTVRIDDRTIICVSASIPDAKAKSDYLEKRKNHSMVTESPRWKNSKKKKEEEEYKPVPEDIQEGIPEEVPEEDEFENMED